MKKYPTPIAKYWLYGLAIASFTSIIVATLYPFEFVFTANISLKAIFGSFQVTSVLKDYVSNLILFIPWGFSVGGILHRRKLNYLLVFTLAILISFGLSMSVEITQFFSDRRVSNFSDVAFNTLGGGVGAFFYWANKPIIDFIVALVSHNRHRLTPKYVGITFITYFVLVYLIVFSLVSNINLSNWNQDFPLIIGNEGTKNRHWEGRINQLHISDRALTPPEIQTAFKEKEVYWLKSGVTLASYLFSDLSDLFPNGEKNDRQNFNNIFDNKVILTWQQKPNIKSNNNLEDNLSVTIDRDRWLQSIDSAEIITKKLQQNNQFTISAIVATNNTQLGDYARIISLSNTPYNRNLTIAQDKENLVLRLRTPVTGTNGNEPEIFIPNIFGDLNFHYLIFTFDGAEIVIYIDRPDNKYSFDFEPEVTFWSYFPFIIPDWQVDLTDFNELSYRIGFYSILLIPLGCLGGVLLSLFNSQKITKFVLIFFICFIPTLLIEILCIAFNWQSVRVFNLTLSLIILLSSTLLCNLYLSKRYFTRKNY